MPYTIADMERVLCEEAGDRVLFCKLTSGVAATVTKLIRQHPSLDDVRAAGRWWRVSTFPPEPVGWSFLAAGVNFAEAVTKGKAGVRPTNGHGQFDPAVDPETQRDLDAMFRGKP